ncbi:MAG: helix-turn-helix domain-containing protein [Mesorhizobium sp.]|uniref:helix-turn-helix domain-containing protein n=1 Tax=Mesorhizobium sp. TaxID=1871066 RepID=UPI0012131AD3|nr:helix-turn-helix domain-containing protein [Mesorhizobium sp.]TIQ40896.1 MAG: helix-turn-helix domain-containing protein [Mesorhizobium sp.]
MPLLNPKQASRYLLEKGVPRSPVTLRNLRVKGGGPHFRKLGNSVYYEPELLDEWINGRLTAPVASTSALPSRAT